MPENDVEFEAIFSDGSTHNHETDKNEWFFDDETHWHACRDKTCSQRFDSEAHTFKWKADVLATDSTEGIKHEECTVCGKTRNEDTVIPVGGPNPEWTKEQEDPFEKERQKKAWILPVVIAAASVLAGAGVTAGIILVKKKKAEKAK